MKKYSILILIILVTGCSQLKYLNQFDGFQGKPKIVKSIQYVIKENDTTEQTKKRTSYLEVYNFDKKGRTILNLEYKSNGELSSAGLFYNYNKKGNVETIIRYNLDSTINFKKEFLFDKKGRKIKEIFDNGGVTTFYYNNNNRKSHIVNKNAVGKIVSESFFYYSEDLKKIRMVTLNRLENTKFETIEILNENGDIIGNTLSFHNGSKMLVQKKYDNFNNKIYHEIVSTKQNGDTIRKNTEIIDYKYDKEGNIIEMKVYSEKGLEYLITYDIIYWK